MFEINIERLEHNLEYNNFQNTNMSFNMNNGIEIDYKIPLGIEDKKGITRFRDVNKNFNIHETIENHKIYMIHFLHVRNKRQSICLHTQEKIITLTLTSSHCEDSSCEDCNNYTSPSNIKVKIKITEEVQKEFIKAMHNLLDIITELEMEEQSESDVESDYSESENPAEDDSNDTDDT